MIQRESNVTFQKWPELKDAINRLISDESGVSIYEKLVKDHHLHSDVHGNERFYLGTEPI